MFDHPGHLGNASGRLLNLHQITPWNVKALQEVFIKGLNEVVKDELAGRQDPTALHDLVSLSIRLKHWL